MTTVKVFMPTRTGLTGHTLMLRKSSDFTAVNGAGDALSESGSTGVFTADVAETWTVSLYATILSSTDAPCWYGFVAVGGTEVVDGLPEESTGARTVTITVTDGTNPLQNATVRLTNGAFSVIATTDASGEVTLNVDDATYTVAVTKPGYSFAGTSLIVDGDETATYEMTAVTITAPTNPDLSAIEVLCLGSAFTAQSGIDIDFRMAAIPSSDQNNAFPGAKVTITSNGSGIARWEAPQGAMIEYKRGSTLTWSSVTLDSDSVTNVTSVIGTP